MKGYKTYEEAKAAYPDCDAVLTTGPEWEYCQGIVGGFFPAQATSNHDGYVYSEDNGLFPTMSSSCYVVAEPPTQAKPKTKVEYKLVDGTANEIAKRMIDGEVFYNKDGTYDYNMARRNGGITLWMSDSGIYYQKVETPMTWIDDAKEFILSSKSDLMCGSFIDALVFDDELYEKELIELCKLVARLNGGCE